MLRTHWGFVAFDFVGRQVSKFLSFSSNGAQFVFGSELIAQEKSDSKYGIFKSLFYTLFKMQHMDTQMYEEHHKRHSIFIKCSLLFIKTRKYTTSLIYFKIEDA